MEKYIYPPAAYEESTEEDNNDTTSLIKIFTYQLGNRVVVGAEALLYSTFPTPPPLYSAGFWTDN
jgi:hypothetical protein